MAAGRWRWCLAIFLVCVTATACSDHPVTAKRAQPVRLDGVDPLAGATWAAPQAPPGSVLTQRGDASRVGWNTDEHTLTAAAVGSPKFGQIAQLPVDGKVYAQPLVADGRVIVATEHDTVYAVDLAGRPIWTTSLLMPGATRFDATTEKVGAGVVCDSVTPEVGINSTPVIDLARRTIYALALDVEAGTMTYRLHALDLDTGRELRRSAPLGGSVTGNALDARDGRVTFNPRTVQQRMGLTLVDGIVYAGFASWCGSGVYHGWILGQRTADLSPAIVYATSPDSYGGGLWESSAGITVDPHGHLVVVSGNGPFDDRADFGDSVLTLTPVPAAGTLRLADSFTPFDQLCRDRHDRDLGSGAPLAVPGHDEYILSSKTGSVYVLSASHLGGYAPPSVDPCTNENRTDLDHVKQELTVDSVPGGMWGTWAYWNDNVYSSGSGARLTQWKLRPDGTIDPQRVAQAPLPFAFPGAVPVTAADLVWTIDVSAQLRAFDAKDVSHQVFHAPLDGFNHFQVPTVAGGRVYVGGAAHLTIFGMR
jgi:hypothetical protein